ncbi:MAG: hypothetical protein AAFX62_05870 [Pseudomonadota bacterium]
MRRVSRGRLALGGGIGVVVGLLAFALVTAPVPELGYPGAFGMGAALFGKGALLLIAPSALIWWRIGYVTPADIVAFASLAVLLGWVLAAQALLGASAPQSRIEANCEPPHSFVRYASIERPSAAIGACVERSRLLVVREDPTLRLISERSPTETRERRMLVMQAVLETRPVLNAALFGLVAGSVGWLLTFGQVWRGALRRRGDTIQ